LGEVAEEARWSAVEGGGTRRSSLDKKKKNTMLFILFIVAVANTRALT
jgi:hypothetical protein